MVEAEENRLDAVSIELDEVQKCHNATGLTDPRSSDSRFFVRVNKSFEFKLGSLLFGMVFEETHSRGHPFQQTRSRTLTLLTECQGCIMTAAISPCQYKPNYVGFEATRAKAVGEIWSSPMCWYTSSRIE